VTQVQTAVGTADQANEVTTSYSDNGRATTLTDGEGNRTTIDYDGHDRPVKTRFPVPTAGANQSSATDYQEIGYDAAGNVTSQRQRDGQVIAFGFDALNRMTSVNRPNGHYWETDDSFTYDLMGKLTSATHNDHAVAFSYDALGRLLSQTDNYYGTTTAEYDAAGRRTRLLYPFGSGELRYDHLVTGEMSVLRDGSYAVLATFGYDQMGRRTSLSRLNGTSTSYGYDPLGRLASLGHDFAGTAHDVAFGYAYNPASQIVSRTANNDAYSFTSLANQNATDSHNGLNQVTASAGTAVTHDARGNTVAIPGSANFGYTVDNRLLTAGGGIYVHDPLGRMMHASPQGADFLYEPGSNRLIGEKTPGAANVTRLYASGPGTDETLLSWTVPGYAVSALHADERGSIIAVSDAAGNVTAINRYDDYGQPQGPGGTGTLSGRFGYTGQAWMPEIGMYNYKARIYNPDTGRGGGRFMQIDPIWPADGMNGYPYVGGDPVNKVDPTGLAEQQECGDFPDGGYSFWSVDEFGESVLTVRTILKTVCLESADTFRLFRYIYGLYSVEGAAFATNEGKLKPQRPQACKNSLQGFAEGLQALGDTWTYTGIGISGAALAAGSPHVAAGGLIVTTVGGLTGAIGQGLEDYNHSQPFLTSGLRFIGNAFYGRLITSGLRGATGMNRTPVDDYFPEVLQEVSKAYTDFLDPERC
jgi:RHS repeat-associated protein